MIKPEDGRPDFMAGSGAAGRMDGVPIKPVSGWDADEATRLKSAMMNRDKMVSAPFSFCECVYRQFSALPFWTVIIRWHVK